MLGWRKVEPHNIFKFLRKALVVGELEGFDPMGLQPMSGPDTANARRAYSHFAGHRLPAPMRGSTRFAVQGEFDNATSECFGNRWDSSRAGFVFQYACHPLACITLAPSSDLPGIHSDTLRDFFVLKAVRCQQHNEGTLACANRTLPATA